MQIKCPQCNQNLRVSENAAGKKAKCPSCGTLLKIPAKICPGIVGFISIPIITRLFPPQDYGNYSLVMATVMVLTTFMGWLPMSIVRFYPAFEKNKKLDIFANNIVNSTLISILIIIPVFIVFFLFIQTRLTSKLYLLEKLSIIS